MNIALVATGGTIGSRKAADGVIKLSDAATDQIASIVGANHVFDKLKLHSERMEFSDLAQFRNIIKGAIDETAPDGVIITHGTDTLAFSSTYLAFAFADTKVPIVICSADLPLTERDSNGIDVLQSSKMFLRSGAPGVYVVYKNAGFAPQVHHAARLLPAHLHERCYYSIGDSRFYDTGLMHGMDFELEGRKVLFVSPYVGLDYSAFNTEGCSAVVHCAYHSGTVNAADLNRFAAQNPDLPIFITAGKNKYDGQDFADNVVLCRGITQTALYIKVLIGLKNNVKDLAAFVKTNACGEIVQP